MAERCPGCHKSFRRLTVHFSQSQTCPEALKYQARAATIVEEEDGDIELGTETTSGGGEPPEETRGEQAQESPIPPLGLTEAQVREILTATLSETLKAVGDTIDKRLERERLATQQQFTQVGPAVLKYLQEEAAKEQAQAQPATNPQEGQPQPPGSNGLSELAKVLAMFIKPSGGGLEQIAETIGSIGKLADALDSLRYTPWKAGFDFAANSIFQQVRTGGKSAEEAAKTLQQSDPNWANNPRQGLEPKP